jgi:hypothetical protein
VRRGARWALVFCLVVAGNAAGNVYAGVRTINLDECSGSCVAPAAHGDPAAERDVAAPGTTLSRSNSGTDGANNARPALKLDGRLMPTVLLGGLPSAVASADRQAQEAHGVSAYDFFADVIDIPLSADALTEISAASLVLFAPSLIGRLTLTDVLSNSAALFVRPPLGPAM